MSTQKSIFVDIDGTIADIRHRVHHIDNEKGSAGKDWEAFYADMSQDSPIYPTINIVNSLREQGWYIILITGRDAARRSATRHWLRKYGVKFDMLLMRPIDDHTTDVEIKRAWLKRMRDGELIIDSVQIPTIVIEDRKKVIEMWREEGLVALHCDEGDF